MFVLGTAAKIVIGAYLLFLVVKNTSKNMNKKEVIVLSSGDEMENVPPEIEADIKPNVKELQSKKGSNGCLAYLITWSQAKLLTCHTRERFAEIVTTEFNAVKNDNVVQHWACCVENHTMKGVHFHLAVKLNKRRRFAEVRNNIKKKFDIEVDFCEWKTVYYDCFTYVTKHDVHYVTSENHPSLENSPLTKKAIMARKNSHYKENTPTDFGPSKTKKTFKHPRMDMNTFYQVVIANNIHTDLDVCALAKKQFDQGKYDLHQFVMSRPQRTRIELINTAWLIEGSPEMLVRKNKSRIELLHEAKEGPHKEGCDGDWLNAAYEVLINNDINIQQFASDIKELLIHGRGKGRCLMICGESNRGKTFILKPLEEIYTTFLCPSDNKFNWVGANNKEVVFLNDLNYSEEGVMKWMTFLNLLEGAAVHISTPKNFHPEDVLWKELNPIFATCLAPIVRIAGGTIDHKQTQMMTNRWKIYHFTQEIKNVVRYPNCGKCFAELLLRETASEE